MRCAPQTVMLAQIGLIIVMLVVTLTVITAVIYVRALDVICEAVVGLFSLYHQRAVVVVMSHVLAEVMVVITS